MYIETDIYIPYSPIYTCSPCFGNNRTLCCNQVITLTFKSQQTQKTYKLFHTR